MILVKKPPLIVTIGTALVLVSAGVLTYVGLRWRLTRAQGLPVGVRAVPQAAVAAVTLSTDTEQWQQLRQFGNPETQATFDAQLAEWRDRWLTQYNIAYAEDIAPWIDAEVTIAWVPESESVTGNESGTVSLGEQGRLLLVPIADPEAAQISAENLPLAAASDEPTEYRGVTLTPLTPTSGDENEALLMGLLGTQLIMVAEDENIAQQAIDAYKGGKNLADLAGYRRSFEHIGVPQAFGKVYLNVPAAAQLLAQSAQPALPAALLNSFQDSRGLAATMTLQSQGLQIASTSWFGPDSDRAYVDTNVPAQLPEYLPSDTLVMASGGNFQQFWQDLSDRQSWGALTALNPDNLALALQGSTGLTLEDDLLPWLGGEFALALMPPPSADSETEDSPTLPNPSLVVLAQVSDRPLAEQTFARLDEVVENRYRFTLTDEPAADVERVRWISPFESTMLARGWLESNIAFLTVGPDTDELIVPQPRRSLARSPLFQLTTGGAPYPNNGYFYVNLETLSQTENNLFLPDLSIENQGLLKAMQAIGVTATVVDEQRLRYDLYLALKRGNRPGPLPSSMSEPDSMEAEPSEQESPPEGEPPTEVEPAAPEAEAAPAE
ncbi:MAG: DUF3352 domain-containing protein [Leptolyngbyaceae cyanobacterium]